MANLQAHGVSFELAETVFRDPFAVEYVDDREDYSEDRFVLVGMAEGNVILLNDIELGMQQKQQVCKESFGKCMICFMPNKMPSTHKCTTHQRQYSARARLVCRPHMRPAP